MGYLPEKENKRPWKPPPPPQQGRKAPNKAFYNSPRWRKARRHFLHKNPLCVICDREGHIKTADVVDHIIPINDGGKKWDWENLQGMCHSHHNQKSGRESQAAQKRKKKMRPINDRKLSAHQATTLFLRLFEDYNFIQTTDFLYGLNELTGEAVSRKDLILDLRMAPNNVSLVLKALRQLKLVDRKVKNRNAFYKLKKEKYESLKQHYQFLTKKLTA